MPNQTRATVVVTKHEGAMYFMPVYFKVDEGGNVRRQPLVYDSFDDAREYLTFEEAQRVVDNRNEDHSCMHVRSWTWDFRAGCWEISEEECGPTSSDHEDFHADG